MPEKSKSSITDNLQKLNRIPSIRPPFPKNKPFVKCLKIEYAKDKVKYFNNLSKNEQKSCLIRLVAKKYNGGTIDNYPDEIAHCTLNTESDFKRLKAKLKMTTFNNQ